MLRGVQVKFKHIGSVTKPTQININPKYKFLVLVFHHVFTNMDNFKGLPDHK